MNRKTFIRTALGLAFLPGVLAKAIQATQQSKAAIPGGVPYAKLKELNDYLNEHIYSPPYSPEAEYLWEHSPFGKSHPSHKDNGESDPWNRCSNADCNIYRPRSPEKVLPILFRRCKL